jgi:hypothetical protein
MAMYLSTVSHVTQTLVYPNKSIAFTEKNHKLG